MRYLLLLLFLVLPVAHAQIGNLHIDFNINEDGSVTERNIYDFILPINGTLNYTISGSASDISVSDGSEPIDFIYSTRTSQDVLAISIAEPTTRIIIEYTAQDVIFYLDSLEHFFTEFEFEEPVGVLTARLKLPVGYTLYDNSFKPADGKILSDGKTIVLEWEKSNVQYVLFSVKFVGPSQDSSLWLAVIAILVGTLLFVFLYLKQRKKEDFLFGFRHDEKIVINYLQEKRIALQRDLEEEFKFSRAQATRIVSKLVEKGLVKKQRYGRTNKLTWIK